MQVHIYSRHRYALIVVDHVDILSIDSGGVNIKVYHNWGGGGGGGGGGGFPELKRGSTKPFIPRSHGLIVVDHVDN